MTKLLMKDTDEIKRMMKKSEVISFDVFDTLIARTVGRPEDIFDLVEKRYNAQAALPMSNFKKIRMAAERAARKNASKEEITLPEIYEMMEVDDAIRKHLMKLEKETEFMNTFAKPEGRELYNYAVKKGKKILIVSDMYLDSEFIKKVLEKNGYRNYQKLFVSSEYGVQKKTGSLFEQVILKTGYRPEQILHIGDNPVSDGISAWKKKIAFCIL